VVEVEDSRRFPSGVLLGEDGLVVGRAAVNQARRRPERFERCPKRLVGKTAVRLGGQVVVVVEMVAAVLDRVVGAARVRQGDSDPDWVRLTHPANWRGDRLEVLREAARRAGIEGVELLSEPEAAAWYFVADRRGNEPEVAVGQAVAVYDLGGGTFDTAILRRDEHGFALIGSPGGGDDWLGGEDFDQQLIDHVLGHVFTRDRDVWQHLTQASTPAWQRAQMVLRDDARGFASDSTPHFRGLIRPHLAGFSARREGVQWCLTSRAVRAVAGTVLVAVGEVRDLDRAAAWRVHDQRGRRPGGTRPDTLRGITPPSSTTRSSDFCWAIGRRSLVLRPTSRLWSPAAQQPHWDRPVNSEPRPCLIDVGFPRSGPQVRTSTSDLKRHAWHTASVASHPRSSTPYQGGEFR
jgi:hypothetical protein